MRLDVGLGRPQRFHLLGLVGAAQQEQPGLGVVEEELDGKPCASEENR